MFSDDPRRHCLAHIRAGMTAEQLHVSQHLSVPSANGCGLFPKPSMDRPQIQQRMQPFSARSPSVIIATTEMQTGGDRARCYLLLFITCNPSHPVTSGSPHPVTRRTDPVTRRTDPVTQ